MASIPTLSAVDQAARLAMTVSVGSVVLQIDNGTYYKLDARPGSNNANWTAVPASYVSGPGAGLITLDGSGTLSYLWTPTVDNNTLAQDLTVVAGAGAVLIGTDANTVSLNRFTGALVLNRTTTLKGGTTGATHFTGVISGAPTTLTIDGGLVVMAGGSANTFTGNTTIATGATLQLGAGGVSRAYLPVAGNITVTGTLTLAYAAGGGATISALTGAGVVTTSVANTLTVSSGTFTGVVSGSLALAKTSASGLTLSGANTYTGGTTIAAGGTLTASHATALGAGAVTVNGTLTYTVNSTGTRTVTVNTGGVINKGGFAHTGTTFVNNGGTINA